jgi:hypothetical protein
MRSWLSERKSIGIEGVSASFVGTRAVHDRWNGRNGDFAFLLATLRTATELGLNHGAIMFLTRSSLPLLGELSELLDELPAPHEKPHVRPFFYIGHGAHQENERITEADRAMIPDFAREVLDWPLHSEREWLPIVRETLPTNSGLSLYLELTRHNIDKLEKMSCGEIVSRLETRARRDLGLAPPLLALSEECGDSTNTRLYSIVDMRRLWLDRFFTKHSYEIERSPLHFYLGRSLRPPPLSLPRPTTLYLLEDGNSEVA